MIGLIEKALYASCSVCMKISMERVSILGRVATAHQMLELDDRVTSLSKEGKL